MLPSDGGETWGLVVNEAMACGVPAIVSDAVGCVDDLVRDGESGFTYACGNVSALTRRMLDLVTLAPDRRWIPKGMHVQYLATCRHSARALARIDIPAEIGNGVDCIVPVEIFDRDGTKVAHADITMWVTPRAKA